MSASAPPAYQKSEPPHVAYQQPGYVGGYEHQPQPGPPGYPPQQTVPNYGTYQPAGAQFNTANNTNVVVVGQPQSAPTVTLVQRKPENYIILSIFTLFCCCWLFGIVALIHAMQVDSAYEGGDIIGARAASRSAKTWNIVGIVFGSISIVMVIIVNVIWIPIVVIANEDTYDHNYY